MNKSFSKLFWVVAFVLFALSLSASPFWEVESDKFDWQNATSHYGTVMRLAKINTQTPRPIKLNAVRLELAKISPILSKKDKDWGKPMPDYPQHKIRTKRQTTREFVETLMSDST